jgi:outer membrane protein assembly factor BamB
MRLLMISLIGFAFATGAATAGPSGDDSPSTALFHNAPTPLSAGAVTSDWPCLLGPTHNEVSPETHLLKQFPAAGPVVVWEMKKGEGYAAPAVAGDRLVLFHRVKNEEVIECLDALTGKRHWRFAYPTAYQDEYGYTNGPRSSPVISNGLVFAIGAEGKLHCLDLLSGKMRWQHDLLGEFNLQPGFFGVGSTPLVEGNLLIVNVGAPGGPCVAGFDVHTGKLVWGAGDQWGPSYASPVPAVLHGRRRVLVFAGGKSRPPTGGLLCIDPANGKVDFTFPWRGTRRESVNASSPVVIGNQIFISECYGSGGVLLDVSPDFHCTPAWTNLTFGTHFMSAVAKDGYLYGVDGHGPNDAFLVCADLKTGKELWRTQPEWEETVTSSDGPRKIGTGTYRCWLMPVDGRCLCLGEFGHLLWIDLNPKGYRELGRAWLFAAEETWTPPVLTKGLLYVCQNARDSLHGTGPRVICYDLRGR